MARIEITAETDNSSIRKAQDALDKIRKAQDKVRASFEKGAIDAKTFNKSIDRLDKRAKTFEKTLDNLSKPRKIDLATDRFDTASRDVSLAGDAESNLRTVGGALGASGLGGAERAISIGAEFPAVIEALPRLKAAAAGLPQTISAAGAALGTSGAGFIGALGIAGIAIGAVAIAFKKFSDDAKKQAEELSSVIDTRRDVAQDIAGGLSSEDARSRLGEINAQREAEAELLTELKQAYADNIESQGALAQGVLRLTPQEQALADQIKQSEGAVASFNTEEQQLNRALQDGALAANDAKIAERELAQERSQGILQEASQEGELASIRERLADSTQGQIDTELKNLEVRRTTLEAELKSLQNNSDQSEEVVNRIDQITESLSFLGEQEDALQSIRANAKTDEQAAREKALESARIQSARATDKVFQAELARAKAGTELAKSLGRERVTSGGALTAGNFFKSFFGNTPEQKEAEKKRLEAEREFAEKELELRKDMADRRFNLELDNFRATEDSIRDFGRQREDALEDLSFLSLKRISKDERRAAEDRSIEFKRGQADITREAQAARKELQAESAASMRDLNATVNQGLRGVNAQFDAFFRRFGLNRQGSSRNGQPQSRFVQGGLFSILNTAPRNP